MKGEMLPKHPSVAYIIPDLPGGINLHIKRSANAWWMNREKVYAILFSFKINSTIKEACRFARITERQYKYFRKYHPQIDELHENYLHLINMRALRVVVNSLDKDVKSAWWWLERRCPQEFGRRKRSKNQGLIDWERENRPRYRGVDGGPWTEAEKAEAEEFDRTHQGSESTQSGSMKITYTYSDRIGGPIYTEEEFHSPDFQKIKIEKERAHALAKATGQSQKPTETPGGE